MKKFKMLIDFIILFITILICDTSLLGERVHEIAGIILIIFILIHILINIKTLNAYMKNWNKLNNANKTGFILELLLLFSTIAIGVTGILISKSLFNFHMSTNIKMLHKLSTAFFIIVMGIHMGMHGVKSGLKSPTRKGIIVSILCLCLGIFGLAKTNYLELFTIENHKFNNKALTKNVSFNNRPDNNCPINMGKANPGSHYREDNNTQNPFRNNRPQGSQEKNQSNKSNKDYKENFNAKGNNPPQFNNNKNFVMNPKASGNFGSETNEHPEFNKNGKFARGEINPQNNIQAGNNLNNPGNRNNNFNPWDNGPANPLDENKNGPKNPAEKENQTEKPEANEEEQRALGAENKGNNQETKDNNNETQNPGENNPSPNQGFNENEFRPFPQGNGFQPAPNQNIMRGGIASKENNNSFNTTKLDSKGSINPQTEGKNEPNKNFSSNNRSKENSQNRGKENNKRKKHSHSNIILYAINTIVGYFGIFALLMCATYWFAYIVNPKSSNNNSEGNIKQEPAGVVKQEIELDEKQSSEQEI